MFSRHDPNTAYDGAQVMKTFFPKGYLVTWQGYGHCLTVETNGLELLEQYQTSRAKKELPMYTNAVAKYACAAESWKLFSQKHWGGWVLGFNLGSCLEFYEGEGR